MLGSKSTFFIARSCNSLSRDRVFHLLDGYSAEQIAVYIKALITLGKPDDFDGATIVKTLWMWHRLGRAGTITITAYVTQE
jgi:hypothetical protein